MQRPKGILFDLDCTLTDRSASLALYADIFANHFRDRLTDGHPSVIRSCLSACDHNGYLPRDKCWAHLIANLAWQKPASHAELDQLWSARWPECTVAASGARQMLEHLAAADIALGIVTNGAINMQERKIDALGFGHLMQVVLVSEAVGYPKPARAIFERACEGLHLPPGGVWFVGDNPVNDIIGARNAGLIDVWVRGDAIWPEERRLPTVTIDRVDDLPRVLATAVVARLKCHIRDSIELSHG